MAREFEESDSAGTMIGKVEAETAGRAQGPDRIGVIALVAGTAIIAWSGILVRFLDVGPLAGAAWRMALAVPALAVWRGSPPEPAARA